MEIIHFNPNDGTLICSQQNHTKDSLRVIPIYGYLITIEGKEDTGKCHLYVNVKNNKNYYVNCKKCLKNYENCKN